MQLEFHPLTVETDLPAGRVRVLHPAAVTLLAMILLVVSVIGTAGGDPLSLARLGTRFSEGNPQGTEGYDGQFVYYIARSPDPGTVAPHLDVPAYRYQRILLPLAARLLALGDPQLIPWTIPLIVILAHTAGVWAVAELLAGWGVNRWYSLVYGLWVGFLLAVRLDLPEPLAYGLIAGALLAQQRGRERLSWILYALAVFAREVTAVFVAAQLLAYLTERRWKEAAGVSLFAVAPFVLFQGGLWLAFGEPGVGSGGEMATPFEWIPFMGLLRIGEYSRVYLAAMLVVFGPAIVLPVVWCLWQSTKSWRSGSRNVIVYACFLNAAVTAMLPFSTFRETGGLLRFACGLVLALLLFAGRSQSKRALNYTVFWLALNAFLLK